MLQIRERKLDRDLVLFTDIQDHLEDRSSQNTVQWSGHHSLCVPIQRKEVGGQALVHVLSGFVQQERFV